MNEFTANPALGDYVARLGAEWAVPALTAVGAEVGREDFQLDAVRAHRHEPQLQTHDRWGNRIDEVCYDPSYHRVLGAAIARGAHTTRGWEASSGAAVARAATFLLFAQVEPGHACPVSMTHSAVAALEDTPLAADWLPRLRARQYDPRLRPGPEKPGALVGMAMTEKQGGSDVRANTTRATHVGAGRYLLTGHKWFCSAPMSDGFLVLSQTERGGEDEGLSCLFVPRVLPDGTRNVFRLQRLKDKLGNRSNASSEVEFDATTGMLVGEPGRGVRAIIPMVQRTRLDCVVATAAGMRQCVAEVLWHVAHRAAFGRALIDQPAMTAVAADLALEAEAAQLTALRLAAAFDDTAPAADVALRRLATPVAKYWVCKRGPHHAYEAMESLGGNGYTEDFPLARRYREQPVMAIWEGAGNVIALDVVRALQRDADSAAALAGELATVKGESAVLDSRVERVLGRLSALAHADADDAALAARGVTEDLALVFQAALLVQYAPTAVAGAFLDTRLGPDRSWQFGAGVPATREILARASSPS